ncbi:hypothetical protein SGGMMB4_03330 [Sodalis glossinidius str. 'morsitans']|nr:hypothetical protein SGGMMB4_03330 [Sodalis glossinidius str. 'morsitans']
MLFSLHNHILCSSIPTLSNAPPPVSDEIKIKIDNITRNKHVMVFSGFSFLGYHDEQALVDKFKHIIFRAIVQYGIGNLCVGAGATREAIGKVYELAKEKGIQTLGRVSEQARESTSLSEHCDECIFISDPMASWQVRDPEGNSYMVYLDTDKAVIQRTGEFLAFGGGQITSRLKNLKRLSAQVSNQPFILILQRAPAVSPHAGRVTPIAM